MKPRAQIVVNILLTCALLVTVVRGARADTHYVSITSTNPVSPFMTWETAATNIQDAIDASSSNDTVLVSNGVYETGGYPTSGLIRTRIALTKRVTLQSVNGPDVTIIKGAGPLGTNAVRCAIVANGCKLSGFTLNGGFTRISGSAGDQLGGGVVGVSNSVITNCIIFGNCAVVGGGAYGGQYWNCTIMGNDALTYGGGAHSASLYHSSVRGNSASNDGGGVFESFLSNCTVESNAAAGRGGGSWQGNLTDCSLQANTSGAEGGGACLGHLTRCLVRSNRGLDGGGASWCTASNCVFSGNSATAGGAAIACTLVGCVLATNVASDRGGGCSGGSASNCVLVGNSASGLLGGGGAEGATLSHCTIVGNHALNGGGARGGVLNQCVVVDNAAQYDGGGSQSASHNDCLLARNTAGQMGGGSADGSVLAGCTIVANVASNQAGGLFACEAYNCIVYSNRAPLYADARPGSFYSCCISSAPGFGGMTNEPQFESVANSNYHLKANSPCIDAGLNFYASSTTDLDGKPRFVRGLIDLGAFEFQGYWGWAMAITNGQTNLTDSAAGDGYPNLLKYAAGGSPTNVDDLAALSAELTNGIFALRLNRNTNASDVTLIVEGSDAATNGAAWIGVASNFAGSWGGATIVSESGTGMPVSVLVLDATPRSGAATNRFLRLRVTRP